LSIAQKTGQVKLIYTFMALQKAPVSQVVDFPYLCFLVTTKNLHPKAFWESLAQSWVKQLKHCIAPPSIRDLIKKSSYPLQDKSFW
jgi:hypothetical protein